MKLFPVKSFSESQTMYHVYPCSHSPLPMSWVNKAGNFGRSLFEKKTQADKNMQTFLRHISLRRFSGSGSWFSFKGINLATLI